jgi:restriction endonuclease Mrr
VPPPLDRAAITVSRLKTSDRSAEKIAVDTALEETERRELRRKARSAILTALRALGGDSRRDAIKERAVALGEFSQRELSAVARERAGARPVRVVDQQLSWALSDLKREGLVVNPERGIWRLSPAARRLDELKHMPYPEYLQTPEWERTRAAALERAEYSCAMDLSHTEGLEVHHRTKERLGSELPTDLIVLCEACLALHREPTPPPPPNG